MRKTTAPDFGPGTPVWRACYDGGRLAVGRATYLGRNGGWRYYADKEREERWAENGLAWHATEEAALRSLVQDHIDLLAGYRLPAWCRLHRHDREARLRCLAAACCRLRELWREKEEGQR